jgi:fructose-1,6-bisphosphatase I
MSISTSRKSITEFMDSSWGGDADLEGLHTVVAAIADGTRRVHDKVQAAALADVLGATGETNVQGELVQKLDAAGSDIFVEVLSRTGRVAAVVSEEIEDPVVPGDSDEQTFIVQIDPVDGSSNIDVAVSIGSIFGIWRREPGDPISEATLLRPGREQVAAAYAIYGSSTVLVTATKGSVNGFTLDTGSGELFLSHPDIQIPEKCEYYSTNEGNFRKLDAPTQRAVAKLRDSHSLRYVGSLVADFHRNLLKGGIFLYPGDSKRPEGKLRLMYEANPLGFVAEQAGGAAYSADQRILDIQPTKSHQRTPLILGNRAEVEEVVAIIQRG